MEALKKYWWLLLLLPIGLYLIYVYRRAEKEVHASTAKAREAKELKRILKEAETETAETV